MNNKKIEIRRGRTLPVSVPVVYDDDGSRVDISGADIITFAVRAQRDGAVFIKKTMSYDDETGYASVKIDPSDTIGQELGTYHYDICISFSDGDDFDLVEWSEFEILASTAEVSS